MTQLRKTALGNSWERTPWDDAEAQRADAQNQWNLIQNQNQWANNRANQGRSDALAMDQGRNNLEVWKMGVQGRQSAQSMAAQERLAALGFQQMKDMYGLGRGAVKEDRLAQQEYDKPMRDLQTAYYADQGTQLKDTRTLTNQQKGWDDQLQADLAAGTLDPSDVAGLTKRVATRPGGGVNAMMPLLQESMGNRRDDEQISADRILADLASDDPTRKKRGIASAQAADPRVKRKLGAVPQNMSEMPATPLSKLPDADAAALAGDIADTAQEANTIHSGAGAYGFAVTPASTKEVAEQAANLRAQIKGMQSSTGASAREIWKNLKSELDTGGWTWNPLRGFGAFDTGNQDINEEAIAILDKEFGGFK